MTPEARKIAADIKRLRAAQMRPGVHVVVQTVKAQLGSYGRNLRSSDANRPLKSTHEN